MVITYSPDSPREDIESFFSEWGNDSSFFVANTSGSTGIPKTVHIEKSYARASAQATVHFLNLKAGDNALMSLNPNTIGGKMMLVRAIEHQLNLHCVKAQANPLKGNSTHYDFVSVAPIQLAAIIDETPEQLQFAKNIIVGGGVISDIYQQKLKALGKTVFQTFGMTETLSHVAMRKVGLETETEYQAMPNVTFSKDAITDTLIIHAPNIGHEALATNDVVELTSSTTFKWIGRADFTINTGGIKVQMETLESHLAQKMDVPFFIWHQPHDQLGQEIILIIEGDVKEEWLSKAFYSDLPKYHAPKKIGAVEKIKRTASDKILRQATFEAIQIKNGLRDIL